MVTQVIMAELTFTLNSFSVCVGGEVDDMYMYVDICGCHRKISDVTLWESPTLFSETGAPIG